MMYETVNFSDRRDQDRMVTAETEPDKKRIARKNNAGRNVRSSKIKLCSCKQEFCGELQSENVFNWDVDWPCDVADVSGCVTRGK